MAKGTISTARTKIADINTNGTNSITGAQLNEALGAIQDTVDELKDTDITLTGTNKTLKDSLNQPLGIPTLSNNTKIAAKVIPYSTSDVTTEVGGIAVAQSSSETVSTTSIGSSSYPARADHQHTIPDTVKIDTFYAKSYIGCPGDASLKNVTVNSGGKLRVKGKTTMESELEVTEGNTTTLGGALIVNSTADIASATTIGGTLEVSSSANFNSSVDVSSQLSVGGSVTLDEGLTVTGSESVEGSLSVTGKATFNNNVIFSKNVKTAADATIQLGESTNKFKGVYTAKVAGDNFQITDSNYNLVSSGTTITTSNSGANINATSNGEITIKTNADTTHEDDDLQYYMDNLDRKINLDAPYISIAANTLNIKGDIIPTTNNTYTLGNDDYLWKSLSVSKISSIGSGGTINPLEITNTANDIKLNTTTGLYLGSSIGVDIDAPGKEVDVNCKDFNVTATSNIDLSVEDGINITANSSDINIIENNTEDSLNQILIQNTGFKAGQDAYITIKCSNVDTGGNDGIIELDAGYNIYLYADSNIYLDAGYNIDLYANNNIDLNADNEFRIYRGWYNLATGNNLYICNLSNDTSEYPCYLKLVSGDIIISNAGSENPFNTKAEGEYISIDHNGYTKMYLNGVYLDSHDDDLKILTESNSIYIDGEAGVDIRSLSGDVNITAEGNIKSILDDSNTSGYVLIGTNESVADPAYIKIEPSNYYLTICSSDTIELTSSLCIIHIDQNVTIYGDENTILGEDTSITYIHGKSIYSNTAITTSSDIRYKDILNDITLSVEDIANAPFFEFNYKGSNAINVGTSAQYWQNVCPKAVVEHDDRLSLNYSGLALGAATTVAKEVVELKKENETLKAENDAIKTELETLKAQFEELKNIINNLK